MPPYTSVDRSVRYPPVALRDWARWRDMQLCWEDLPLRYALPTMRADEPASLPLPAGLRPRVPLLPN